MAQRARADASAELVLELRAQADRGVAVQAPPSVLIPELAFILMSSNWALSSVNQCGVAASHGCHRLDSGTLRSAAVSIIARVPMAMLRPGPPAARPPPDRLLRRRRRRGGGLRGVARRWRATAGRAVDRRGQTTVLLAGSLVAGVGGLMSVLRLAASGTPAARGARAALRPRAGRRVPGHQQRPAPSGPPACRGRRGSITVVGDEDQSIDPLAGRRHPQHPRLRARPPGRARREARAQLPLDRQHPARRQRHHREATPSAGRSACSPRRARASRIVLFEGETERDEADFVVSRIEEALSPTPWRRATSRSSTGRTPSRACWKTRCARAICPTRSWAARASSIAPRSRTSSRYLRAMANPDDGLALQRIINVPARGIGAATVERIGDTHLRAEDLAPGQRAGAAWRQELTTRLLGIGRARARRWRRSSR